MWFYAPEVIYKFFGENLTDWFGFACYGKIQ